MDPADAPHRWTWAAQADFLEELGQSGVVAWAARKVGLSPRGAYALRLRPEAALFRDGWAAADAALFSTVLQIALTRIVEGTPVDIVRGGVVTGQKTVFSEKLLLSTLALLKSRDDARRSTAPPLEQPLSGGAAVAHDPNPRDALDAAIAALRAAAATGTAPVPPVPAVAAGAAVPYDAVAGHAERVVRARLRLDDYAARETEREECEAAGRDWVPRELAPLPPLRHIRPIDPDEPEPEELYRRMKRQIATMLADHDATVAAGAGNAGAEKNAAECEAV